jgi:predicted transcriptional regulator
MDKILSARVDESVIQQVGILARELNTSKKAIIEAAIKLYSEQTGLEKKNECF